MVRYFSAKILSDYIRIKASLRDISRNMIEEFDIKSFIVFLTALNAENVVFWLQKVPLQNITVRNRRCRWGF